MAEPNNNISGNLGVVVVGNNTVIHMPSTPGGQPPPNTPVTTDGPTENSEADELKVVKKVSKFIQNDYLNKYAKVNRNPLKPEQTPIHEVFVKPDFESVDNSCHSEEHEGDLMYKIFDSSDNRRSPSRVMIYGPTSIGKTTLCEKYAYDWANPEFPSPRPFDQFKIVILLKLCEVKGTLEEILEREIFCNRLTQDEKAKFFSYMKKHPSEFLFLLDGVSECNLDELTDIKNLVMDKDYRSVYLIATIRPEMTDNWLELSKAFHSRYCISGYNKGDVIEFVSNYFCRNEMKCGGLLNYLESNSDLMEMAEIPLVRLVVCEMWNEQDKLLTLTKVLRRHTDVVSRLFNLKTGQENKEIVTQNVLDSHGKLALLGVMKPLEDKALSLFTENELTECKVDLKVGFLGTIKLGERSYRFANEKMQQYFAARWIVENWASKQAHELLNTMLHNSECRMYSSVLIFIAGLLAEKKDRDTLLLFLETARTFLEDSCYCNKMDLFLASVAEAWREENAEAILDLFKGFEQGFKPFTKTKTPNTYPLDMSYGAAQGLGLIVRKLQATRLNLSGIMISVAEAKLIAAKCIEKNSKLKSVKFSHSCLCPDAVKAVCVALATMPSLEEVDLTCCNFADKGLLAIADLIQDGLPGIISLQLGNNLGHPVQKEQVKPSKQQPFSRQESSTKLVIENLTNFQDECQNSPPSERVITALINAILKKGDELEEISLPSSCVGKLTRQWLNAFGQNGQLKRIKLHLKELDKTLQDDLVELVNNMEELEIMSVVLEDEESHRTEFATYSSLKERTGGKIKLTIKDHTHSVHGPVNVLANFQTG